MPCSPCTLEKARYIEQNVATSNRELTSLVEPTYQWRRIQGGRGGLSPPLVDLGGISPLTNCGNESDVTADLSRRFVLLEQICYRNRSVGNNYAFVKLLPPGDLFLPCFLPISMHLQDGVLFYLDQEDDEGIY